MGTIVVDNSVPLPLFLSDEDDTYARVVIGRSIAGDDLLAPALCLLEFGNAVLKAGRQQRLTEAEAAFAQRKFASLPIEFRFLPETPADLPPVHALAQRRSLSFYDAAYLSLALGAGARLASLDDALVGAARAEGVDVVAVPAAQD